jgi:hypothetical protein
MRGTRRAVTAAMARRTDVRMVAEALASSGGARMIKAITRRWSFPL